MNKRLKNIIFYKLYYDLRQVEIIPYKDTIWFIDRKEKYWYFVYHKKNNHLWWRHQFFKNYFDLFSLKRADSEYVMSRWVEEVLNSRVDTTTKCEFKDVLLVEEVLNSRVDTTMGEVLPFRQEGEEVLNSRVDTTDEMPGQDGRRVEEVLNSRVGITVLFNGDVEIVVEEVLNSTNHE